MLNVLHCCRTVERSIFEKLVYIGAICKSESSNVHLVAVTSAGDLLCFSCNDVSDDCDKSDV